MTIMMCSGLSSLVVVFVVVPSSPLSLSLSLSQADRQQERQAQAFEARTRGFERERPEARDAGEAAVQKSIPSFQSLASFDFEIPFCLCLSAKPLTPPTVWPQVIWDTTVIALQVTVNRYTSAKTDGTICSPPFDDESTHDSNFWDQRRRQVEERSRLSLTHSRLHVMYGIREACPEEQAVASVCLH